ncbi:MAG: RpiB/LacA/LacB family sugar-phosphate isomerase [Anaerolineales bacterium]|nr:RpiB/LacA/LacB family sugar-phosphate isomerase [Anaerolineales bacterium]
MKIAVLNEISAAGKNEHIIAALDGRGFEVFNLGNTSSEDSNPLLYIHTGLMSAVLIHAGLVDFVVGGCGTGQGYLNAVMQFPGMFCGHLLTPLDAFLFARINAGNCVSLALNQGYGWAGDINLRILFDELFTPDTGGGYPPHRSAPQAEGRELLDALSHAAHPSMAGILQALPEIITRPAFAFPAFRSFLTDASIEDELLGSVVSQALQNSSREK